MDSYEDNNESVSLHALADTSPSTGTLYFIQIDQSSLSPVVLANSVSENQNNLSLLPKTTPQLVMSEPEATLKKQTSKKVKATSVMQNIHARVTQNILIKEASSLKTSVNIEKTKEKSSTFLNGCVHITGRLAPSRELAVMPTCLKLHRNSITLRCDLPSLVRFGPVKGVNKKLTHSEANQLVLQATAANEPIFLMNRDASSVGHVDVADKDKSNWLGLLPIGDRTTANVWLYEVAGELYGVTTKQISSGTPLAMGYSMKYFIEHKLPDGMPVLCLDDILSKTSSKSWKCFECFDTLNAPAAHIKKRATRKFVNIRSRCTFCKRVFASKHSLKRHIQNNKCIMLNSETMDEPSPSCQNPATGTPINRSLCPTPINVEPRTQNEEPSTQLKPTETSHEESRLPSDESLQNYTQCLDISTNLFDPDQMPNLDTSASDLNPYSLLPLRYKESNDLAAGAEYAKFSRVLLETCNSDDFSKVKSNTDEDVVIKCPYCKESILKSQHKQHHRHCTSQQYKCSCGLKFYRMESYHQHLQVKHKEKEQSTKKEHFTCKECQSIFKRRGMLVNHMWTKHKKKVSLSVEKKIRHYPCTGCPKVYRTAAKRKRHMLTHHPGLEISGICTVEAERRPVSPALCPECPREYATQSKLNQHIRSHHPKRKSLLRNFKW